MGSALLCDTDVMSLETNGSQRLKHWAKSSSTLVQDELAASSEIRNLDTIYGAQPAYLRRRAAPRPDLLLQFSPRLVMI